jgi:hypothetical protein
MFCKPWLVPYNLPHPECRPDEIWFCNIAGLCVLDRVAYRSKRVGLVAYDHDGEQLGESYLPVFIQRAELVQCGVDVDTMLGEPGYVSRRVRREDNDSGQFSRRLVSVPD